MCSQRVPLQYMNLTSMCNMPSSERYDFSSIYRANDYGDATGFIATDSTNQLVVLSFRGSSDISNWEANLDFKLTDVDLCDGCQAHNGFWDSWNTVSDEVTSQIDSAMSDNSGYKLVVTGHSLGGALAALAGTALRNSGHTLDLVSFFYAFPASRISFVAVFVAVFVAIQLPLEKLPVTN